MCPLRLSRHLPRHIPLLVVLYSTSINIGGCGVGVRIVDFFSNKDYQSVKPYCNSYRGRSAISIIHGRSQACGGGGGYNILARTTRLAQSLGNVPLIRN